MIIFFLIDSTQIFVNPFFFFFFFGGGVNWQCSASGFCKDFLQWGFMWVNCKYRRNFNCMCLKFSQPFAIFVANKRFYGLFVGSKSCIITVYKL